ncbi:MAG: hypothetical protein AVDCRST_MAG35-3043 [uncultured Quadrisphaera sp.]|uniref:HTH hxlR-type domain-containing protein n=1 Tax=uncultured Quadrisphaera sp. TaxID=904978 RepID=A0A6J4QGJ5_9ACTN|nr:MAG: hypothetical protein AVDCRST_MAG35-3043 [uncultured Quadrisphaera sp.]
MSAAGATSSPADASPLEACPISPLIELVFSRWTTPVLWALQHQGPLRFGEIRKQLGPVTSKVLTSRLRQLERDGLVQRTWVGGVPPRADYAITDLGLSLSPAFRELATWTHANMGDVHTARARYDEAGRPRPA